MLKSMFADEATDRSLQLNLIHLNNNLIDLPGKVLNKEFWTAPVVILFQLADIFHCVPKCSFFSTAIL